MGIHSTIITNRRGNILFSKYFVHGVIENLVYEQQLNVHLQPLLTEHSVPLMGMHFIILKEIMVVFMKIGELIFLIGGTEEADEILLSDVMDCIGKVLLEVLVDVTENNFLTPESYAKWILCLDEMVSQGIVESLDPENISKVWKLKSH